MNILVIEDNKERIAWFWKNLAATGINLVVAEDSKSGVNHINETKFDYIMLDHDLGIIPNIEIRTSKVFLPSGDGTGYEVAKAISKSFSKDATVIMHTWNPAGAQNMQKVLSSKAIYAPFGTPHFDELVSELTGRKIDRVQELLDIVKKGNADVVKKTSAIITDKTIGGK